VKLLVVVAVRTLERTKALDAVEGAVKVKATVDGTMARMQVVMRIKLIGRVLR
jgi:hypothetical protein